MDRAKYKEKAKEKIKNRKWEFWKPQVYFTLIELGITLLVLLIPAIILVATGAEEKTITDTMGIVGSIVGSITGMLEVAFAVGYAKYCLDFVHGKELNWKDPFKFMTNFFVPAILLNLLVGLNVTIGAILLIVPGIMAAIGLIYYNLVYAENTDLKVTETLKQAWNITNGHKMDLFVLSLSFIGWSLLVPFTLCILAIWLVPYMTVTFILVYDDLKKAAK